jgi:hypothetical protein
MAADVPPIWLIAATLLVAVASVYGLLARLALKYWRLRLGDAFQSLRGDLRNPLIQWQVDCLRICSSWRWVLRHPFERDDWPKSCRKVLGPVPAGMPTQAQEVTLERLRRIEEGMSLARELAVPDALRDIVDAADREGWQVGATGSAMAFYPSSGTGPVVVSKGRRRERREGSFPAVAAGRTAHAWPPDSERHPRIASPNPMADAR